MTLGAGAGINFNAGVAAYGVPIRVRYFTPNYSGAGSYYDRPQLTASGSDVWTSGIPQSIDTYQGAAEAVLLEQGRIKMGDMRLYVSGGLPTSGFFRVGVGSPIANEYVVNGGGVVDQQFMNVTIYKKLYLSLLQTGSLIDEE